MSVGFEYWEMLEPMRYYDKKREDLSENLKKKYDAMINNENDEYIATCKWDGEWTMFIKWEDRILIRSRSISKVTGKYGDKTAHLPHLVEEMKLWPNNTVILGEVCWGEFGTVSTDVGTILRCLPAKAVERQKDHKLVVKVFDCLALGGEVYMNIGYADRIAEAHNMLSLTNINGKGYFTLTDICPSDLTPAEFADSIISQGGEGVVIQRKDCIYESGKRSAWKTLKLKQRLPEMEFKVLSSIPATRDYDGKYPDTWPYWEIVYSSKFVPGDYATISNMILLENVFKTYELVENPTEEEKEHGYPVTKPYFYGWHMGIRFEYNGVLCDASSGLTDADREWLGTEEAQQLISNGELYVVVRGMQLTEHSIRHPVIVRLRSDI